MTTAIVPGCPVDESFDPLSPEFLADPYAVMADQPHGRAPVFFAPSIGYYVVSRDEEAFDRPGEFDIHRTGAENHLAFGKGLHYCLGANLGKLEAQIAVAELARRYPALSLVPGQHLRGSPHLPPQHLVPRPPGPEGPHAP